MAYEPKLSDLDEGGYQPSLKDIQESGPSESPKPWSLDQDMTFGIPHTVVNAIPNLIHNLQNIYGGAAGTMQKIGASVFDTGENYNPEDATQRIANDPSGVGAKIGSMLPQAMLGGASIPGQAASAGVIGGLTAQPDETNLGGLLPSGKLGAGLEDALLTLAAGKVLPKVLPTAKALGNKVYDFFSSEKPAKDLLTELGGGVSSHQQASKDIVKSIKDRYANNYAPAKEFYDFVDNAAGNKKIYEKVDPLITTAMDKYKDTISRMEDLNIGDLFHNFKANPTYRNAHALQSELGVMISELQHGLKMGTATRQEIQNIASIRGMLKNDINGFLQKEGDALGMPLSNMYTKASDIYEKDVSPYLLTPKLRQIVREGRTNVPNVEKIFENPYDIEHPLTGEKKTGPINAILNDLPPETKDKILFKKLKGFDNVDNPKKLAKSLETALSGNFTHLDRPDLRKAIEDIYNKEFRKNVLKYGATPGIATLGVEEYLRRK